MELIGGLVLAVLCAFGYGTYPFFTKKVIHKIGTLLTLFAVHIVLVFFLMLFFMFYNKIVLPDFKVWIYIVVGSVVGALSIVLFYKAIHIGNISINVPLANLQAVISVLLGFYLFNEKLSLMQYFAVAVVIIGSLLASTRFSKIKRREKFFVEGAFLSIVVAFGWSVFNMLTNYSIKEIGPLHTNLYMETLIFVFIVLMVVLFGEDVKKIKELKGNDVLYAGLLFALGAVAFYFSLNYGLFSIVIPVVSASALFSVILGRWLLKEQMETNQTVGVAMIILGLVLVWL